MSGLLAHMFVSQKPQGADSTKVRKGDWNDFHVFSGGNHGSLLMRDTSDAVYGANWLQSVAVGNVLVSAGVGALPVYSSVITLGNEATESTNNVGIVIHANLPIETHSNFANGIEAYTHSATGFRAPTFRAQRSRGTYSIMAAVQNGDTLGYFQALGWNSADNAWLGGFHLESKALANWTTAGMQDAMVDIGTGKAIGAGSAQIRLRDDVGTGVGIAATPLTDLQLTIGNSALGWTTDNVYDLGKGTTGTNHRPRTGYFGKGVCVGSVTFSGLPASPVEGMLIGVTDSNTAVWGATIAGGGANHVLAYYNGTNWTVAGK